MKRFILAAILVSTSANAAPPPVGSEQWELLHPYADWVTDARLPSGYLCCSIADGRVVAARQKDSHWQIKFDREVDFPTPPGWLDVPDEAVLHVSNPVGLPVAWFWQGQIRCFVPPSGV